ncbi:MAG: hypothetical protein JO013_13310 [Alphaproteobacteria bacterium]|nr:hypothetical protein [Alphaproteobacteria bacterium]
MRIGLAVVAAALAIGGSAASAMPLPVFLDKAEALQRKGMLALFSSDLSTLKNEVRAAMESLRAERLAAKRAGRPQAYCPPQDSGAMNSDELLAALRQIPPAQRARMDVKDGMRTILARRFPCR